MSLIEAVQAGDLEQVKALLDAGADVNVYGEGNTTPLIEAARKGNVELARLLLSAGAEPALADDSKETALLKAAAEGHGPMVSLLGPFASQDDRDTARAFLAAVGKTAGPMAEDLDAGESFMRRVAEAGAKASSVLGNDNPRNRLDRVERSEKLKK